MAKALRIVDINNFRAFAMPVLTCVSVFKYNQGVIIVYAF